MTPVDAFVSVVARISVSRTTRVPGGILKIRRPGMTPVIAAGNRYFLAAGAHFEMFPSVREWIAWERAMYERLHGLSITEDARGLVAPDLPGTDLAELLARGALSEAAVRSVAVTLRDLHARDLSHGDANLGNFLFDGERARAIDFDARHLLGTPMHLRVADDLLAFLTDLLGRTGEGAWERSARAFLEAYAPEALVLRALEHLSRPRGFLAQSLFRARGHAASLVLLSERFDVLLGGRIH